MLATVDTPALRFDGRDVTDVPSHDDVEGYALLACPHCDTVRDARYPFCCEMAGESTPARVLLPV